MTPNLEIYELASMTRAEAEQLFADLRNERGQVVSITQRAGGDVIVVSPFSVDATRVLLLEVGGQIQEGACINHVC